jgi:glycosyltransferase involved in cell wall biosynthesis
MTERTLTVYFVDGVPGAASARYRVFNALEQLRNVGIEGRLLAQDYDPKKALSAHGGGPGVLVIHRAPWDERLACLLESARASGIRAFYDIDDLVFEPMAIPWVRGVSRLSESERDLYEDGVRRYYRALRSCDGVLTTTRALATYAAAEGVPAFVHRNGLDQRSLDTAEASRQARRSRQEVVLYYGAGTATHDVDFQACAPALARLLSRHSHAQLMVQGDVRLMDRLEAFGQRVRRWPWMPWPDYIWGLAQADVNLAPLELGNPYSEVKSELKWFEAGILGVPTVASATSAFSEVIRQGENGFMARTEDEWFDFLEELVGNVERRETAGAAADHEARASYTPGSMGAGLVDLLSRCAAADDLTALAEEMGDRAVAPSRTNAGITAKDAVARGQSEPPKVTIGWLAPALPRGGGGARNILRMARHLQTFGHDVTLYIDPQGQYRSEKELKAFLETNFPGEAVPVVMGFENIRPSAALISTFWLTAESLREIDACREKFYLVQDFEPYFYPMSEEYLRAEATYRFGFHHITSGRWCTKHLREQYQARSDSFDFPLDRSIYYPRPVPEERVGPRVLFFSRPEMPRRCYNLGLQALLKLRERLPDVQITLFGSDEVDPKSVPFPCEVLKNIPDLDQLAELYSSADAALVLSTTNTSLVPFEVAACGCPVVDIDLEVNRVNYMGSEAMLLAPATPQALADALHRLLANAELHRRHREAGLRLAETLPNEEQAARRVEEILLQGLGVVHSKESSTSFALNGARGRLDGLALDVTCRQEEGVLGELQPGKEIAQTFECSEPNLAAIAVKAALYGRANACSLELSLYGEDNASPLQRVRQSMLENTEDGWIVFRFAPLPDSAGAGYKFVLSSPDAKPGNACGLYYARESLYLKGSLQANGRNGKGALVFQTFVERSESDEILKLIRPERAGLVSRGGDSRAPQVTSLTVGEQSGMREEIRSLRARLERMEQRQTDVARRVTDLHNFFGAMRGTLPYRAARKIARTLRLVRR